MLIDLKVNGDDRGSLIAIENNCNVPFDIKRVYYIFDTDSTSTRGCHAHRDLQQLVICVSGSCVFTLDDGENAIDYTLNSPKIGLLINGIKWREMSEFSNDCVLLVLADKYYDPSDYIDNYLEFKKITKDNHDS